MPPRVFDDMTPAQIATIESWLEAQAFELGAFRTRVSVLLKVLGCRSSQFYSVLRRQRPDLWQAMNRAREVWRDKLYAVARAQGMRYELADAVNVTQDALRAARKAANSKQAPPWGKPPTDSVADALEESIRDYEVECWPPPRPFPIMEAYGAAVGKSVKEARLHMEYHRPDLYKRYVALRAKFDAAFDKACLDRAPVEDIIDWFDTTRPAVYARRKRLGLVPTKQKRISDDATGY